MTNHYHCPDGCEKPQPVTLDDGKTYCGRCLHKYGDMVEVIPCDSDICEVPNERDEPGRSDGLGGTEG